MKNVYLPLCLLVATSAGAVSNLMQSLMSNETTRAQCEKLSTDQKIALDDFFTDVEALAQEAQERFDAAVKRNSEGSEVFKDMVASEKLTFNVTLVEQPQDVTRMVD